MGCDDVSDDNQYKYIGQKRCLMDLECLLISLIVLPLFSFTLYFISNKIFKTLEIDIRTYFFVVAIINRKMI